MYFNSHPHEEDDWNCSYNRFSGLLFQLTSSRRGWQNKKKRLAQQRKFQLTSSRRGWPRATVRNKRRYIISTHILTKRMTDFHINDELLTRYFNSHPHEEDDVWRLHWHIRRNEFQLTSSRRGWRVLCHYWHNLETFQLTSSRRGWPLKNWFGVHVAKSFQLTSSRRGWRFWNNCLDRWHDISTHILTKRMTNAVEDCLCKCGISTHILTKRMTAILNKNNLFKIAYYISNKHFISIVDIFFHFHIYF